MRAVQHQPPRAPVRALLRVVAAVAPVARALAHELPRVPPMIKEDGSSVTAADYAVQALLTHLLREELGAGGFICEENAAALLAANRPDAVQLYLSAVRGVLGWMTEPSALALIDAPAPRNDDWWLLDPIDGTAGFIQGAHFSICIARVTEGQVRLGAVGCPRLAAHGDTAVQVDGAGSAVAAERSTGAWLWDEATGTCSELRRAAWSEPLRWARSMNRRQLPIRAQGPIDSLGLRTESIHIDSQCKYALVAAGRADLALRLPGARGPEHSWDHVAGAMVAAEAGAVASDVCGAPLDASHGADLSANRGVLCAPLEIHADVVRALATLATEGDH